MREREKPTEIKKERERERYKEIKRKKEDEMRERDTCRDKEREIIQRTIQIGIQRKNQIERETMRKKERLYQAI